MAITVQRDGQRVYLLGDTYPLRDRIKSIGGHWDGERRAWWVGLAKEDAARQLTAEPAVTGGTRTRENPDTIRLTGKGRYKGRSYFLGSSTRDGRRVRCLTLPDDNGDFLDFWADRDAVAVEKTYQPREYRGRMEYTTLGSIARFVEREKRNRASGGAVCAECGRGGDLVEDLEDGLMKHRGCCDMPSD